jgi:hypothetical protein
VNGGGHWDWTGLGWGLDCGHWSLLGTGGLTSGDRAMAFFPPPPPFSLSSSSWLDSSVVTVGVLLLLMELELGDRTAKLADRRTRWPTGSQRAKEGHKPHHITRAESSSSGITSSGMTLGNPRAVADMSGNVAVGQCCALVLLIATAIRVHLYIYF